MSHNQKTVTMIARDMLGMMDHRAFPVYTVTYEQHVTLFQARVSLLLAWDKSGGDPTVCNDGTHKGAVCTEGAQQGEGCKILGLCDLNAVYDDVKAELDAETRRKPPVFCTVAPEPIDDGSEDYGCP